jgi:hypothetical protein
MEPDILGELRSKSTVTPAQGEGDFTGLGIDGECLVLGERGRGEQEQQRKQERSRCRSHRISGLPMLSWSRHFAEPSALKSLKTTTPSALLMMLTILSHETTHGRSTPGCGKGR